MPARVAAIKAAIETRQDFSCLAHGGEDAVVRWARTRGLNGRALILEWQQNYRQAQAWSAAQGQQRAAARPARIETEFRDLDFWADEPEDDRGDPDDRDDELKQTTKACDACRGLGVAKDGSPCSRCNGTGRIDRDDVDDGGGDEDEEDGDE